MVVNGKSGAARSSGKVSAAWDCSVGASCIHGLTCEEEAANACVQLEE